LHLIFDPHLNVTGFIAIFNIV